MAELRLHSRRRRDRILKSDKLQFSSDKLQFVVGSLLV
jgi:hypothetical protein